jgi:hypothetical protein
MKLILTISVFVIIYSFVNYPHRPLSGNVYHVKNGGNDALDGLTDATAWETVAKVNSFSATTGFSPSDSINFKCGDTWNEQLNIVNSGASGDPIIISSYGTGPKPTFTGFKKAINWTDSSGIWFTTLTGGVAYQNTIMIDGKLRAKGRFPNADTVLPCLTNSYYKASLNHQSIDFTGAELVLKNFVWIWDINKILSIENVATKDSITLATPLTYNANFAGASSCFFQNSVKCLDLPYEWAVDSILKKIWVKSVDTPNLYYSTIDTTVTNHNVSYVTFNNVNISGANRIGFSADTNRNIVLQNSTIRDCGKNGIGLNKSHQTHITNDSVFECLNDGLYTRWSSDTCSFLDSYWGKCGVYAGMNLSGNSASCGLFHYGLNPIFRHNRLDSTGYHGFYWFGANAFVDSNWMTNCGLNKGDGASIYCFPGISCTGTIIQNNIIGNYNIPTGVPAGFGFGGIYLDGSVSGVTVRNNVCFDFTGASIIMNGGSNNSATGNLCLNAYNQCFYTANAAAISNTPIKHNILYSTYTLAEPVFFAGQFNSLQDSNIILRATAPDSLIRYGQTMFWYSLSGWQTLSSNDLHSTSTFPSLATSQTGTLYINPTDHDSTINFSGRKVSALNDVYENSVIIPAYGGMLLFNARPVNTTNVGSLKFN